MSEDDRPEKAPARLLVEGGPGVAERARKVLAASLAEHPAPWRWGNAGYPDQINGKPETLALYDANGTEIVGTDGDDWSWVSCDSPRVRALIAAAPEMEALLRHIAVEVLPFEYGRPDGKEGGIAEAAQEILARIDAAKAGA